jgi:hypothetical protein
MRASSTLSLLVLVLLALLPAVRASTLEPMAIEAYIDSLKAVRQLGEKLQAEGQRGFLEREIVPREGQPFDPHARAVKTLQRDFAADYQALGQIVRRHGFTSAESWAALGDRIVLAYGAIKAEAESPTILQLARQGQGIDAQLLQLLPPAQRRQMAQAVSMARALAQVPAADKRAVRPYTARLDHVFSQGL